MTVILSTPPSSATPAASRSVRRQTAGVLLVVLAIGLSADPAAAAPLVAVRHADQEYLGRIVSLNRTRCVLMDSHGRLTELPVPEIQQATPTGRTYRPGTISDFRSSLIAETGRGYEVVGTTHYIVCAPRGQARLYAELFERIFRDAEQFFRVRRITIRPPDVPLVAVVFSTRGEFIRYCLQDGLQPGPGLQGYYSLVSNRVVLFDQTGSARSAASATGTPGLHGPPMAISEDTAGTVVHEAIHQVSYNIGIHSRIGTTPLWLVEGLATVMEPPVMRQRHGRNSPARINRERYDWFRTRHRPRRPGGTLARLIASDDLFRQRALDAYSESWALTFFLLENPVRRRQFSSYLKTMTDRGRQDHYPPEQRLADFEQHFGDVGTLEIQFLRAMDRL